MTALTALLWVLLAAMCLPVAVLAALPVAWWLEDRPRGGRGMPIPLGELPPAYPGWLPRTLPPPLEITAPLDPVGAEIDSWGYDEPAWDYWRELHAVDPVL